MASASDLFTKEIREILSAKVDAYPLYVHCFNDIMNNGLYLKLKNETVSGRGSVDSESAYTGPPADKIKPYLSKLFKRRPAVKKVDILFISRYRPLNIAGLKGEKNDYLFNPVISDICKRPSQPRMALASVGGQGKHYADRRVENFNLLDFIALGLLFKSVFRSFRLYLKYRRIKNRLSSVQKALFSGFFSLPSLLSSHLFDFCLDRAIREADPKVIVSNDDVLTFKPSTNPSCRMIVLQSALINEESEKYREMLFSDFLEDSLLSDYFCVSGPHSQSAKQRFPYDTKEVIVTGQPRFDNLARADELFDAYNIRMKFGLAADGKTLLWVTETHALSLEENEKSISTIYDAVNSLENVQLVIKLHPAEDQEATLYRKNKSYAPIIVKGNQDISELLYVSDLMITKFSTTVIEAAILEKPTIVLNLSGKPDIVPYVEKGVAIGVYRKEDLTRAIQDALFNSKVRQDLALAQQRFIYEYAYVQDGKASERVAEVIMGTVEAF